MISRVSCWNESRRSNFKKKKRRHKGRRITFGREDGKAELEGNGDGCDHISLDTCIRASRIKSLM